MRQRVAAAAIAGHTDHRHDPRHHQDEQAQNDKHNVYLEVRRCRPTVTPSSGTVNPKPDLPGANMRRSPAAMTRPPARSVDDTAVADGKLTRNIVLATALELID